MGLPGSPCILRLLPAGEKGIVGDQDVAAVNAAQGEEEPLTAQSPEA